MPELPEVQTIVNDLQTLTGDAITGFSSDFKKAIKSDDFEKAIIKGKIKGVLRLGKNIIIELDSKKFIIVHLKMTGKLILNSQKKTNNEKHLHHIFYLKKNGSLEFHDIRKFATLELVDENKLIELRNAKGIDPFSPSFTVEKFTEIIDSKKNKVIKSFLMDQTAISGIGNIYASEIPFDAGLNPLRSVSGLDENEIKKLFKSIIKILQRAISLRGTSFSDYRDASGHKGGFQNHLRVYGKAGKKCSQCDTIIEKSIVQQRSTFYCPTCQS